MSMCASMSMCEWKTWCGKIGCVNQLCANPCCCPGSSGWHSGLLCPVASPAGACKDVFWSCVLCVNPCCIMPLMHPVMDDAECCDQCNRYCGACCFCVCPCAAAITIEAAAGPIHERLFPGFSCPGYLEQAGFPVMDVSPCQWFCVSCCCPPCCPGLVLGQSYREHRMRRSGGELEVRRRILQTQT